MKNGFIHKKKLHLKKKMKCLKTSWIIAPALLYVCIKCIWRQNSKIVLQMVFTPKCTVLYCAEVSKLHTTLPAFLLL